MRHVNLRRIETGCNGCTMLVAPDRGKDGKATKSKEKDRKRSEERRRRSALLPGKKCRREVAGYPKFMSPLLLPALPKVIQYLQFQQTSSWEVMKIVGWSKLPRSLSFLPLPLPPMDKTMMERDGKARKRERGEGKKKAEANRAPHTFYGRAGGTSRSDILPVRLHSAWRPLKSRPPRDYRR